MEKIKRIKATPFIMFVVKDIRLMEHDPQTQYKFNKFWATFWFLQMPLVILLAIKFSHFWVEISVMYFTQASLWANFATHFSGMSSAIAATDTREKVEDILEDTSALTPDQSLQLSTAALPSLDIVE